MVYEETVVLSLPFDEALGEVKAERALDEVPQIGVLLPCNVVVRETAEGVVIEAMDPGIMATVTGHEGIRPIADEARARVSDALDRLQALAD